MFTNLVTQLHQQEAAFQQIQARLDILNHLTSDANRGLSIPQIIRRVVERLNEHFQPLTASYCCLEASGRGCSEPPGPSETDMPAGLDRAIAPSYVSVLQIHSYLALEDLSTDERGVSLSPSLLSSETLALLDVAVNLGEVCVGILRLTSATPHAWNAHEITTLINVSQHLSVILQSDRYHQDNRWAEESLKRLESSHQFFCQHLPVMLHITDCTDRITETSQYWLEKTGFAAQDVLGRRLVEFLTPESRCYAETVMFPTYLRSGSCKDIPYKMVKKNGEILEVLLSGIIERDDRGNVVRCIQVLVDTTQQRCVERQLFREKELAQVTLQAIGDAVITTDAKGNVEYLNPIAEEITGWRIHEAKGRPIPEIFKIIHEITREPLPNPVDDVLTTRHSVQLTNHPVLVTRCGAEYAIDDSVSPICDRTGGLLGVVLVFRDVTHARFLERQLAWQARHDSLTGLVNRREFEAQLLQAIHTTQTENRQHVLCYLDLDQFKIVNDSYGHAAGDELLRQVSQLLRSHTSPHDTVARLGGDEFGILFHQTSMVQAEQVANSLREMIQEFRFVWQNKTALICASIGLVAINGESQDLMQIMSDVDAACYAAKDRGRNRVHLYHRDDHDIAQQREDRHWIGRINRAFDENRFQLFYQSIEPTAAGGDRPPCQYGEVLLRLVDEVGELVQPMTFIPAAEKYSLMPVVDRWVIQTFFDRFQYQPPMVKKSNLSCPTYLYTINLSGASVNDDQFLDFLKHQFSQHRLAPENVCFEITERVAIANLNKAAQLMYELKQIGCRFALDDFGSGVSSFNYLRHLPLDYLKIDGRFVKGIVHDPINYAIVASINHIGHLMGIQTIAEYVETDAIRSKLKDIGVDYVQGYVIKPPCPMNLAI